MITNSPNPDDIGTIAKLELIERHAQKVQFGTGSFVKATDLSEIEKAKLESIPKADRLSVLNGMRSKNKSAKRRANKKIADASRRRNRK